MLKKTIASFTCNEALAFSAFKFVAGTLNTSHSALFFHLSPSSVSSCAYALVQ